MILVRLNGLTIRTDGKGQVKLENGGFTVDITNGNITVYGGNATAHTDGTVQLKAPTAEQNNVLETTQSSVDTKAYSIGDALPDGWVVGGISPTTGAIFSVEPVTSALDGYQTWYIGEDRAKTLLAEGHENARQPDMAEWYALHDNIVKADRNQEARIDTRNDPSGQYWSSETHPKNSCYARLQYFDNGGAQGLSVKGSTICYIRCVRDEPGLTLAYKLC